MRIAGINSPNYHLDQTNKPKKPPSHGKSTEGGSAHLPQTAGAQKIPALASQEKVSRQKLYQPNAALPEQSARNVVQGYSNVHASDERVRFYSQNEATQAGSWHAYTSNGRSEAGPIPDNTSHKARAAISQYLQTQYIEERLHFTAVLGVDDYA